MKRFFSIIIMNVVVVLSINAQNLCSTPKFMGIPIDGTKTKMIEQLQSKGFNYDKNKDCLKGRFNGRKVKLWIQSQNDNVWGVKVQYYKTFWEDKMAKRYNDLFDDLWNRGKYEYVSGQKLGFREKVSVNSEGQATIGYSSEPIPSRETPKAVFKSNDGTIVRIALKGRCKIYVYLYYENPNNKPEYEGDL